MTEDHHEKESYLERAFWRFIKRVVVDKLNFINQLKIYVWKRHLLCSLLYSGKKPDNQSESESWDHYQKWKLMKVRYFDGSFRSVFIDSNWHVSLKRGNRLCNVHLTYCDILYTDGLTLSEFWMTCFSERRKSLCNVRLTYCDKP